MISISFNFTFSYRISIYSSGVDISVVCAYAYACQHGVINIHTSYTFVHFNLYILSIDESLYLTHEKLNQ